MSDTAAQYPFTREVVQCPYPHFARMRKENPVPQVGDLPLHLVTRYEDLQAVTADVATFTNRRTPDHAGYSAIDYFPTDPEVRELMSQVPTVPVLAHADRPEHTRQRLAVARWFTPRMIKTRWQDTIESLTDELIRGFERDGELDMMTQFAIPLPVRIIAKILGFEDSAVADLKRWSDAFLKSPAGSSSRDRWMRIATDHVEAHRYLGAQIEDRLAHPEKTDLLASLVSETREGGSTEERPLSLVEVRTIVNQLLVAGNETTTQLIGQTMHAIATTPGVLDRLRAEPELVGQAVEEGLRYVSPVTGLYRGVERDAEIGGCPVSAGSVLFVSWGSANHDETVFPDPDTFRLDRENSAKHVAFGSGVHFCVGANLARAEARTAIRALVTRLPKLRVDPDLELDYGVLLSNRALQTLPMRFEPAHAVL